MSLAGRSEHIALPSGRYHLRHWGDDDAPLLLMLHGWMEESSTFQFVVECLRERWHVVAPDWLGYGQSEWRHRPYWWAECLVDLDALTTRLSPDRAVRIVGHSMGGNIASLWGGTRPERLERLVMLEAFGHVPSDADAPSRLFPNDLYGQWLRDGSAPPTHTRHPDREAFVQRLRQANPRLTLERADRLAQHMGQARPDGTWALAVDPWHRSVFNHQLHQPDHFLGAWSRLTCPVLSVTAGQSAVLDLMQRSFGGAQALNARLQHIRNLQAVHLPDAGHSPQHDQPEAVAAAIENFLRAPHAHAVAA